MPKPDRTPEEVYADFIKSRDAELEASGEDFSVGGRIATDEESLAEFIEARDRGNPAASQDAEDARMDAEGRRPLTSKGRKAKEARDAARAAAKEAGGGDFEPAE